MRKKVSLFFICFCFCTFLFSLSAVASTTITLEDGAEVKLSNAPVGTLTAQCEVITGEVKQTTGTGTTYSLANQTIYLLTANTTISSSDNLVFYSEVSYCPGRDVGGAVKNAYYIDMEGPGDGLTSYTTSDTPQTPDSDGIFSYIRRLDLYNEDTDESICFFFVVVNPSYLVSSVKLTPSLTNTSSGVKVSWSKASGATGYYVYRKTSSATSYTKIKTIKSGSTISYTDTAVKSKNGTTYLYKVIPYSGSKKGTSTATKIVRLSSPTLSSVKNTASKKITVKWKKNSKATGYQIQYSKSKTFASGNKTVKVSGAKKVSKAISKLTKKKTYYVRIRTYKTVNGKTYYSAWSSKKSVKISK